MTLGGNSSKNKIPKGSDWPNLAKLSEKKKKKMALLNSLFTHHSPLITVPLSSPVSFLNLVACCRSSLRRRCSRPRIGAPPLLCLASTRLIYLSCGACRFTLNE
ncbi:hypothetical protein ACOSQ3_013290 [Xanthoceras sorbifolium]